MSTPVQLCVIYSYIDGTEVRWIAMHYFAQQIIVRCLFIMGHTTVSHSLVWMERWDKLQRAGVAVFFG